MSGFGDSEPEDAWDPDDSVDALVDNLIRRLAAIIALRVLDEMTEERLSWLAADLGHIRDRVQRGQLERRLH